MATMNDVVDFILTISDIAEKQNYSNEEIQWILQDLSGIFPGQSWIKPTVNRDFVTITS